MNVSLRWLLRNPTVTVTVTCPCSPRTHATLKQIRSSSSSSSSSFASSSGNVISGSIRFMQIFAGVRWRGGVKWEWDRWKWRFSLHSFTDFRTFYIHGHTTAFRWYDCQWPWAYFKVTGLFHNKFLKNGVWYGKSYYRLLLGNHTRAFDCCHFWWP